MTDKLPIERLEQLLQLSESEEAGYAKLIASLEFEGRRPCDDYYRDLRDWRDHVNALKELIALRKAEPKCIENTNDPAGLDRLMRGR